MHQDSHNLPMIQRLICASAAGGVEGLCFAPLDRIKHLMMLKTRTPGQSNLSVLNSIIKNSIAKPSTVFGGVGPYAFQKMAQKGIVFSTQSKIKDDLVHSFNFDPVHAGIIGGLGGATAEWAALQSVDTTKIRMQIKGVGLMHAIKDVYAEGGLLAFYAGSRATLGRNWTGSAIGFGMYEWVKEHTGQSKMDDVLAAGVAGVSRTFPTQIWEAIKVRQQMNKIPADLSVVGGFRYIINTEGLSGLMQGLMTRTVLTSFKFAASLWGFNQMIKNVFKTESISFEDERVKTVGSNRIYSQPSQVENQHSISNNPDSRPKSPKNGF
jgi:hypothetical protein